MKIYLQVGGVLPVWHGVHCAWAQLTPHGFTVVFMVLWQVKQMGVVPLVLFTLWVPEVTLLKKSELCCCSGSTSGFGQDRGPIVPAWSFRHQGMAEAWPGIASRVNGGV